MNSLASRLRSAAARRTATLLLLLTGAAGGWGLGTRSPASLQASLPSPASESFGLSTSEAAQARTLLVRSNCLVCHRIGDAGGDSGPDLTNYAMRDVRAEDLEAFLRDPRSWYPSSTMPAYSRLTRAERILIANYVCGLLGERTRAALPPGARLDSNVCGPRFMTTQEITR